MNNFGLKKLRTTPYKGFTMPASPIKLAPHIPPATQHSSPQPSRSIRRLQSAQSFSTNFSTSNTPSLISQQRQQQQQQRNISGAHKDLISSLQLNSSAGPHHDRSRSNSDAAITSISQGGPAPRRHAMARKIVALNSSAKSQLEALIRDGPPRDDVVGGLADLRHFVLIDGLDADGDGMVCSA